jgi:hypothetical protein
MSNLLILLSFGLGYHHPMGQDITVGMSQCHAGVYRWPATSAKGQSYMKYYLSSGIYVDVYEN